MSRVIVDANLFISHLLYPQAPDRLPFRLVQTIFERQMTHVLVEELFHEVERAVEKSAYLSQRISAADVQRLRESLESVSEVVSLVGVPILPVLRDPHDDYLLTAAWNFSVDLLVTGDRDLLDARQRIGPPRILTVAEFLDERQL